MTDAPVQSTAPLAIVMISLNETHNMRAVLENISSLAQEVFLVDSFSSDDTVSIAEEFDVHVVQRKFTGFGDQWNFAMKELPITSPWTMKLDPDERITPELTTAIRSALAAPSCDGYTLDRRLWFMGAAMPVKQRILRLWRTGTCQFSDVLVNEHPLVDGKIGHLTGILEHHDSPDLHHWFDKQNRYSTAEARTAFEGRALAATPRLLGTALERRMSLKRAYRHIPFRHVLMFLYCWLLLGAWRSGRPGLIWSRLRATVFRMREDKLYEMRRLGAAYDNHTRAEHRRRK
ncbi:glycosyltransferase family 2 protein [Roseovarius sp. TE539]|uniref:glycosyltransferase family 2 protein n=1 Tax=Roseovarius sp. TE539 TaxID=2249812 RepID=UPI000DDE0B09|nr:glycosyltransferase family 2 protein [Roseovarius sp. TE539]RBI69003.1 glycosyltransferase family 2 protein [Roseovarius sp. TE539]